MNTKAPGSGGAYSGVGTEAQAPIPTIPKNQHSTPCGSCPWTRRVRPGALGGSSAETFIGQVYGPMWLPCHDRQDFSDPGWRLKRGVAQCVGAAVFRGVYGHTAAALPPGLLDASACAPSASGKVFGSFAEFLAHHKQITLIEAMAQLREEPPLVLLAKEFMRLSPDMVMPVPDDIGEGSEGR